MPKISKTPATETAIINRITRALETLSPTAQIRVMRYIESASYERLETQSMKRHALTGDMPKLTAVDAPRS